MPVADAGQVQLDYERAGSGPPLLLIMGMSGTRWHWGEPFLERAREDFDAITFDHRGIGASSRLEAPFSLRELADDAVGLLDALELESAHVMGISMGGMVAQELALAYPDRVRSLVLGCTYCGGPGSSLAGPDVMGPIADAMQSGDRERALRVGWEVNVSPRFAADEAAWQRFHDIAERHAVAVPVIMAQLQAIGAYDVSARLGQVTAPTLVVHGTLDRMVPFSNAQLIVDKIPGARLEAFEGVGHMFVWEQPDRAADLVRDHAGAVVGQ